MGIIDMLNHTAGGQEMGVEVGVLLQILKQSNQHKKWHLGYLCYGSRYWYGTYLIFKFTSMGIVTIQYPVVGTGTVF
jgi:hypothetical protein